MINGTLQHVLIRIEICMHTHLYTHTYTAACHQSRTPSTFNNAAFTHVNVSLYIPELEDVDCFLFVQGPECVQTG